MTEDLPAYQVVTWILIAVGWAIVNSQHNKRETRKEARVMADNSKRLTVEVTKLAIQYFCSRDEHLASDIKSELQVLEIEFERFPLFKRGSTLMTRFVEFSDLVTGGNFESQSRVVLSSHSSELAGIRRARNALMGEIEHQFTVHYC